MNQTTTNAPRRPVSLPGCDTGPDGKPFHWGPILKVHTIGDINIVESVKHTDRSTTSFHPYIAGRNTNRSYDTLDSAVIGAIAIKREGVNTRADEYFDLTTLGRVGDED